MGDRLKMRYYGHRKLFIADMSRIFSNCRHYNEPDTEYVKSANALEKYYIAKMKDAGAWEKWDCSVSILTNEIPVNCFRFSPYFPIWFNKTRVFQLHIFTSSQHPR